MIALKRILPLLLLLPLLLSGCRTGAPEETDLFAMDTLMNIKIWGDSDGSAARLVTQEIDRLSALFSVTHPTAELYLLNSTGRAELSEETVQLLTAALSASERTGGAFDPTVYPLVRLWGFTDELRKVPSPDERAEALNHVGIQNVSLSGTTVTLAEGSMLDFGGIAKGYAAERCAELLAQAGVEAALLSLGGNVQTLGSKPDGTLWTVGIANPEAPSEAIAKLTFSGSKALVTSGGYQRYFEENGVRYHHILDPKTGCPAESGLTSVTVLADSGTLADALSTALFVMGLDKAADFWRASDDFDAVFLTDSGEIYETEGAASLLGGCEFKVIRR